MRTHALKLAALCMLLAATSSAHAARKLSTADCVRLLKQIDDRQNGGGDIKALIYVVQKEKGKMDVVTQAVVYRREAEGDNLVIVFTSPKSEQGKGYLVLDRNLWSYDPSVGRWERRTDRERIAGTNSRRGDFDASRLASMFDPTFVGIEKIGDREAYKLSLRAKPGLDLEFPSVTLWVDTTSENPIKREEFALSGKLMRKSIFTNWQMYTDEKEGEIGWYPQTIYFNDALVPTSVTSIIFKAKERGPLPANIFTKAWLESKSR